MPYSPTTWVNGSAPALSATNLNNIETGIVNSINKDGSVAMTAQFVTVAGSATTPSIAPTGDTNTGIFFPSADTMAFVEGGTEVIRIASTGQINIGTSSNATSTILNVNGAGNPRIRLSGTTEARIDLEDISVLDSNQPFQYLVSDDGNLIIGNANRLGSATTNSTERLRITNVGQVQTIVGTQTTPSIAISTDTNTGIYWAGADKLAISEGGRGLTFDELKMTLSMGAMI